MTAPWGVHRVHIGDELRARAGLCLSQPRERLRGDLQVESVDQNLRREELGAPSRTASAMARATLIEATGVHDSAATATDSFGFVGTRFEFV